MTEDKDKKSDEGWFVRSNDEGVFIARCPYCSDTFYDDDARKVLNRISGHVLKKIGEGHGAFEQVPESWGNVHKKKIREKLEARHKKVRDVVESVPVDRLREMDKREREELFRRVLPELGDEFSVKDVADALGIDTTGGSNDPNYALVYRVVHQVRDRVDWLVKSGYGKLGVVEPGGVEEETVAEEEGGGPVDDNDEPVGSEDKVEAPCCIGGEAEDVPEELSVSLEGDGFSVSVEATGSLNVVKVLRRLDQLGDGVRLPKKHRC